MHHVEYNSLRVYTQLSEFTEEGGYFVAAIPNFDSWNTF
jgi:hypothetical protein